MRDSRRKRASAGSLGGLALVSAVALAEVAWSHHAVLISLTLLGPMVASFAATPRETTLAAIYAVGVSILLGVPDGILFTADHTVRIAVVAAAGVLSVWSARQRELRAEALARVMHVAEVAQRAILRPPPPRLGPIAFAARYVSASEEALIGGDLFETAFTPFGIRVVLGDVKGKGLDAVQLASVVLGGFREMAFATEELADVAHLLSERVAKEAPTDEDFVTAVVVEFAEHGGGARVVNCGHHPPIRVSGGEATFVRTTAWLPLGMSDHYESEAVLMEAGDRLILYTDGLVEVRSRRGVAFPLAAQADVLRLDDMNAVLDAVLGRLLEHAGGRLSDDLAILLAERSW